MYPVEADGDDVRAPMCSGGACAVAGRYTLPVEGDCHVIVRPRHVESDGRGQVETCISNGHSSTGCSK